MFDFLVSQLPKPFISVPSLISQRCENPSTKISNKKEKVPYYFFKYLAEQNCEITLNCKIP